MTLTTHAVVGGSLALLLRHHPVLGIFAAFFSHFVLDAVPHWHYSLPSLKEDPRGAMYYSLDFGPAFARDAAKVFLDGLSGVFVSLALAYFFSPAAWQLSLLGGLAGMLPDGLEILYYLWRKLPLTEIQVLHEWAHAKIRLDRSPLLGIAGQLAIILIFVSILILK